LGYTRENNNDVVYQLTELGNEKNLGINESQIQRVGSVSNCREISTWHSWSHIVFDWRNVSI